MLNYQVKIGLVPIRRDCSPRPGMFNWEYAEERGKKLVSYIESHFTKENVMIRIQPFLYDRKNIFTVNRKISTFFSHVITLLYIDFFHSVFYLI